MRVNEDDCGDEQWIAPFPFLSRARERFGDVLFQHFLCVPLREDFESGHQRIEAVKPRNDSDAQKFPLTEDLFCQTWQQLVGPLQEEFKSQGWALFPRGSRMLGDGLAYLAGQLNEQRLHTLHIDVQNTKAVRTPEKQKQPHL